METQNFILEGCKREVAIVMTADDLEPHYQKAYREAQPEIVAEGFRKGKVPIAIIKKKFGKAIETHALEDIASEAFSEFAANEDVRPVGRAALRDIRRESDGGVTFTIAYEVLPDFELSDYRGLELKKILYNVTDEDVDKEIEELCLKYAKTEPAEQITDDLHLVTVQFRRLDEQTGMPILGGEPEAYSIFLKREPANSELRASLLNAKKGDTFHHALPDRDNPERTYKTLASAQEITRIVPAEFTDEFVVQVTQGQFYTTEDLREEYFRQIQAFWERTSEDNLNEQIIQKLLEANEFSPPHSLVDSVIASMLKQDVERLPEKKLPSDFDARRYAKNAMPVAINTARWMIIRERIIQAEGVKIEEEDIEKHLERITASFGGANNLEYLRSALAANEAAQEQMLVGKLMDVLRGYAVITELDEEALRSEEPSLA